MSRAGGCYFQVWYGNKVLELKPGMTAIQVATKEELPDVIRAVMEAADPPPMNWSTLMYVFGQEKEDGYAQEKTDAGRNCRKATTGRYSCFTGEKRG